MRTALIASLALAVVCAVALYAASSARSASDVPLLQSVRRNLQPQDLQDATSTSTTTRRAFAYYPRPPSAPVQPATFAPVRAPTMSPVMVTSAPVPAPVATTAAPVTTTSAPVAAPTSSSLLPLAFVGNNGSPSNTFPLARCQGDCDSDADCASGLTCFQRTYAPGVPGCSGTAGFGSGIDYCINPADVALPASIQGTPSATTLLKMYWQEGFLWQELPTDPVFCMKCDDVTPNCFAGQNVFVAPCQANITTEDPTNWQMIFQPNGAFYIKIATSDLCLTLPLVKLDPLTVEKCSPFNEKQLFFAQNGQAAAGSRFEISPVTEQGSCVSQIHHPKTGERLFLFPCIYPRYWTTSFWNFYSV